MLFQFARYHEGFTYVRHTLVGTAYASSALSLNSLITVTTELIMEHLH